MLPQLFPYVVPCASERNANALIRVLLRNDAKTRTVPVPCGTSYAYTTEMFNTLTSGYVWLSQASYDRLVHYTNQINLTPRDTIVSEIFKAVQPTHKKSIEELE